MTRRTAVLTLVAMLAFASNSLLCRGALGNGWIDPASFTTLRIAGGALALALLVRLPGRADRHASGGGWLSGIVMFAYAIAFSLAYVRITAATGALLLFGAVQATMLGAGLLAGERLRAAQWTGLALSIAGLAVLTGPGLARPDLLGAVLMLVAGAAWGVYSLRGRGVSDSLAANAANFARCLPLALVASGIALALSTPRVTMPGLVLALTSGALASGLGYAVWFAALRGLTVTQASIVQLAVPPLAASGGVLLLGETLSARLVLGGACVLGGIALVVITRARRVSVPVLRPVLQEAEEDEPAPRRAGGQRG